MERGNVRCRLTSTETARHFYESAGSAGEGSPAGKFGSSGSFRISKVLAPRKSEGATTSLTRFTDLNGFNDAFLFYIQRRTREV